MWPMLAGIRPLLGEGGHLGEFFTLDTHSTWKNRNGVAAEIEDGMENPYPAVAAPYQVAVQNLASSGTFVGDPGCSATVTALSKDD